MTDLQPLIEKAREGDPLPLFERLKRRLVRYALSIFQKRSFGALRKTYAEAVHYAWEGLKYSVEKYEDGVRSFTSYTYRAIEILVLRDIEKWRRHWSRYTRVRLDSMGPREYMKLSGLQNSESTAGLRVFVNRLLLVCAPKERECLRKRYLEGKSRELVAEEMGYSSPESVDRTIDRAKARLRPMLIEVPRGV